MKPHQQIINKHCPFCRALFKARSALESHLATRHADQYTKGEIDIDALPDSESADEQSMSGLNASALNSLGLAGLTGLDNGDNSSNGNLNAFNSLFASNLLNASGASSGGDLNHLLQDSINNGNNSEMANQLRQLISNLPDLKNLMSINNGGNEMNDEEDDDDQLNDVDNSVVMNNNNNESTVTSKKKGDFALDLSKPLDLS